jgi:hypothetical protein
MAIKDDIRKVTRTGEILVQRGVIDQEMLDKAMLLQSAELDSRRKLGEILVDDLNCDRHEIYRELARVFAFSEIDLENEEIDEAKTEFVKHIYDTVKKDERSRMLSNNILPYRVEGKRRDTLLVLTDDPTDRDRVLLAKKFGFKYVEMAYSRQEHRRNYRRSARRRS